jgi:hypothetical protein
MRHLISVVAAIVLLLAADAVCAQQRCNNRDTIGCVYDAEYGWIVSGTRPIKQPDRAAAPDYPRSTPEAPKLDLPRVDESYDPGSAYMSRLDVIPMSGRRPAGRWSVDVALTPDGTFRSSSMTTDVDLAVSLETIHITATCDFTRSPARGARRPDVEITLTYSSTAGAQGAPLTWIDLRRPKFESLTGINVWTISPRSASTSVQEWPVGQMLPSQFSEGDAELRFQYANYRIDLATVPGDGFREAFAALAPCWSSTRYWDQQYANGRATTSPISTASTASINPPVISAGPAAGSADPGVPSPTGGSRSLRRLINRPVPPPPWTLLAVHVDVPIYYDPGSVHRAGGLGYVTMLVTGPTKSRREEAEVSCGEQRWRAAKSTRFDGPSGTGNPIGADRGPGPWQSAVDVYWMPLYKVACGS